MFSVSLF